MLNEKEKDRQEENACSAFDRVSPTLSGPRRPAGPPAAAVWSPRPGAGRRGRLGRDTGFTALCQAWGGRRPLRGRLYLEISERAERGTRWVSRRSRLCRGRIWERRGLPASPLPARATPLGPEGPGGLGRGFLRQEGHCPLRTPACCGVPPQTPVRAMRVGQGLLPVLP